MSIVLEFKAGGKPVMRGQAYMWSVLRSKGVGALFTVGDIDREGNDRHTANARDFCRRLVAAGIATLDHEEPPKRGVSGRKVYRLKSAPRNLPPINRSGETPRAHVGQQYMWNVLRKGGLWTAYDLAKFASTDDHEIAHTTAKAYLKRLKVAGYVDIVDRRPAPKPSIYRLSPARNTGPIAPMILRSKLVFDPNLDEVPGTIEAEVAP